METKTFGMIAATSQWVVAFTLMTVASVNGSERLIGWALLAGMAATILTGWMLIERSRSKLMDYLAHQDLRLSAAVSNAIGDRRPTPIR